MSETRLNNTSPLKPNNISFDRAYVANLRDQSPFHNGKKNKDFVNPSLVSNLVFYNTGAEKVNNPHNYIDQTKPKNRGYDLNGYVNHEPKNVRAHSNPPLEPVQVQTRQNFTRPERSYNRSTRSANRDEPQDDLISHYNHTHKESIRTESKQTDFIPVNGSIISNAEGLVCDCCINNRMHKKKQLEKQKQMEKEIDLAKQTYKNQNKILEREDKKQMDQKKNIHTSNHKSKRRCREFEEDY